MTKLDAYGWSAKLADAISALPDDAKIHGFEMVLNTDAKPFNMMLRVHLLAPIDGYNVVNGKEYSGWREKRVWLKPDVFVWWSEVIDDGKDS